MMIDSYGRVLNNRQECGNKIAFNGRMGVITGFNLYEMLSNSIYSNGDLGIDVDAPGVTPNDPTSSRNFPELLYRQTIFDFNTGRILTRLTGRINNFTGPRVLVQIFHNSACDPSGNGEGSVLVDSFELSGNGTFTRTIPRAFGVFTATATTHTVPAKTSEFSRCL
jgi:hypothetical protein